MGLQCKKLRMPAVYVDIRTRLIPFTILFCDKHLDCVCLNGPNRELIPFVCQPDTDDVGSKYQPYQFSRSFWFWSRGLREELSQEEFHLSP